MKILMINYEFPPIGAGAGNATYYLAKEFAKKHNVLVLTSHFLNLPHFEQSEKEGFKILRIPVGRKRIDRSSLFEIFIFMLKGIFKAKKIMKMQKPDITFAFFTLPSGLIALWLKKIYKIPYIISLRGADVPGFFGKRMKLTYFLTKPLIRKIWQKAKRVMANSQGLKELALETEPNLEIEVIKNGVDSQFFKPSQRETKKNKEIKILFVGRLDKQKGVEYLIRAIPELKFKIKNEKLKIIIIGDGQLKKELKDLSIRLKVENDIFFLGWLKKEELLKQYQKADIFILPSLSEGMPNTLLEAMACGLPVVATKVAGSGEIVKEGKNGFLVPPKNSQKLAEVLIILIKNSILRKKMARQSRKIALEYNWEKIAEKYTPRIMITNKNLTS